MNRSLLRNRDFRLVSGSVGLSALGDWVAMIALGLQVKEISDSGFAVAALWICLFGPSVLVAGHAGLLVDRFEATRLLAVVSAAGAVIALALSFLGGLVPILVLTALLGTVFAISQPAEFALVPPLAGEERIQVANGHMETIRYIGFGIGPLLGGLLFATGSFQLAMIVDAATFAAVACAALALRIKREPVKADSGEAGRARDGIAYLFADRTLSLVMSIAFASLLFMSAIWVGELFFVQDVLEMGDVTYGAMLSFWTVGMAFGALLLSSRVAVAALATIGLAAAAIQGLALGLPALWLSVAFFFGCSFVGGVAHGLKNVMFRSLIHVRVPAHLHGRAFAAYNGIRNSAELGAFAAGGLLIATIGARGTVAFAGGLSAVAGTIGLLILLRRNRGWAGAEPRSATAAEEIAHPTHEPTVASADEVGRID